MTIRLAHPLLALFGAAVLAFAFNAAMDSTRLAEPSAAHATR